MPPVQSPPPEASEYLTVADVARLLKLNQQTIRNWIEDRSLAATRVGCLVRIRRADVEALVGPLEAVGSRDQFRTVAEVAEALKLNQQTIRNWIDAGTLPAIRAGRRVRIRVGDLDELLESGATSSPHPAPPACPTAEDFWLGNLPAAFPPFD